jgi:hypothetical protein
MDHDEDAWQNQHAAALWHASSHHLVSGRIGLDREMP